jgi:hypothetical protein
MQTERIIPLAGLLLILIRIYLSIKKNRQRPRLLAAEKFLEAFIDEVQDLSQGKGDAFEFLKSAFPGHEKAYLKFRTYLKGKTLQQFDEAWREYYCYSKENPRPFPEQYFAAGNIALAKEKRALALRRIRNLLSFAKKFTSPSLKHPLAAVRKISLLRRAQQNILHIFVAKHSYLILRKK